MSGRVALFPGSFDPATRGHMDILLRALTLFDRVIAAVAQHAAKRPLIAVEERRRLLRAAAGEAGAGERVETCSFDGLIVDLARRRGACAIIRGLRNASDYDYEAGMSGMNRVMHDGVETIFLACAPEYGFISSTLVRQIYAMGGDIRPFVPEAVAGHLEKARGEAK